MDSSTINSKACGKLHVFAVKYRIAEYSIAFIVLVGSLLFSFTPVHQREIPRVVVPINRSYTVYALDPSISQKKLHEQVSMIALVLFGTGIPIGVNLIMNYVLPKFLPRTRNISFDVRDFHLSLLTSVSLSQLLTHFMKNMTGRFRPCFYDMCQWQQLTQEWDGVTNLCTNAKGEKEGRKSFPSGHSSYAWATLFLLTLYLLGRSRLTCETRNNSIMSGASKNIKLFICFAPTFLASWVAITRSIDNWHHYSDILAGSLIGAASALIGYSYNYGSIFRWDAAGIPLQEYDRLLKIKSRDRNQSSDANHQHLQDDLEEGNIPEVYPGIDQGGTVRDVDYIVSVSPKV